VVILTDTDVRNYCLGIAQLIPVFLVALFVLDNKAPTEALGSAGKQASPDQDQESYRHRLEEADRLLDELDNSIDAMHADPEAVKPLRASRYELTKLRDELVDSVAALATASERQGNISKRSDAYGRETILTQDTITIVLAIVLGMVGEVFAIWGSIGLINAKVALSWSATMALLTAGSLSAFAISRLMRASTLKVHTRFLAIWSILVLGVASNTAFLISASVRIAH
jgi:hypothetical protein